MKKNSGLTLIEALIVISIFTVMALLSTNTYKNWQRQVQLTNGSDELRELLVQAQQLSVAVADDSTWGVHLEDDSYTLFKGSSYNVLDPENDTRYFRGVYIINPTSSLSDGLGGFSSDVVFSRFNGETINVGTISLTTVFSKENIKSITIESNGQVNYE